MSDVCNCGNWARNGAVGFPVGHYDIGKVCKSMSDPVNHPPHYITPSGMEAIDVIEAFGFGYRLGTAFKYMARAGKKDDRKQDLRKAIWFLNRELEKS